MDSHSPSFSRREPCLGHNRSSAQNVSIDERDGQTPMSQQISMNIQQQMGGSWLLDVGYCGNFGRNFTAGSYDLNQLDPKFFPLDWRCRTRSTIRMPAGCRARSARRDISRLQSLRPYPYYGSITVRNPRLGSFNSHLMILSVEKRMSNGLTAMLSYTGGKVISDSTRDTGQLRPTSNRQVSFNIRMASQSRRGTITSIRPTSRAAP